MMAKELYAKPDHPCRCEAYRVTRYAPRYEMAHPDKRCLRIATIEIDGKKLCRPHAGMHALDLIMKGEVK